jgi:hypothetical protein
MEATGSQKQGSGIGQSGPDKILKPSRASILKLCNKMYVLELCVFCVDLGGGCNEKINCVDKKKLISRH